MTEIEIIRSYIKDAQDQIEQFGFDDEEFVEIKLREINEWTKELAKLV